MSTTALRNVRPSEGGFPVKSPAWSRVAVLSLLAAGLSLMQGDTALSQVVTAGTGIDPLSILDLQVKPNVLVVLDTSGSMRFPPSAAGASCPTQPTGFGCADFHIGADDPIAKLYQAKQALTTVLQQHASDTNFGFASYGVRNTGKVLIEPSLPDSNVQSGPLTYVSVDPNADIFTGGSGGASIGQGTVADFFTPGNTGTYLGTTSQNVFNSFRPMNQVYPGPGCATGTNCRFYLFSRILRSNLEFRFNTASGSAGLQPGFPAPFSCPLPPVNIFPQDPNTDSDPTRTDIPRPCFKLSTTAAGTPGAVFYYTSGTWEASDLSDANLCLSSARLQSVAACATNNVGAITPFLKAEMPVDGSCGDALGVPCKMGGGGWVNNTAATFDGTNPAASQAADPNAVYGIMASQATPLAGLLDNVRANFGTFFPNYQAGQANYVLLVTDGDDSCANNRTLDPPNAAQNNWNNSPRIGTFVIGFGLNTPVLNDIAQAGSGGAFNSATQHWSGGINAFTAGNLQDLVDKMNQALQQIALSGEFSDTQTVTESVYEYGAVAGVDPHNPDTRYTRSVPLLLQSTFEMPGFIGHLNAFRNSGTTPPTSVQVWDAGDMLCQKITGFPMTTTAPAKCNVTGSHATKMGNGQFPFGPNGFTNTSFRWGALTAASTLTGAVATAPDYVQGSGRLQRRIFTTTRNGVFPFAYNSVNVDGASQLPSDGGPTVPLWPPSTSSPGVDPDQQGSAYPAGLLDGALGIASMSFPTLQSTFGACMRSGTDLLPSDCSNTSRQLGLAMKEAREMILAFTAGAATVRDGAGLPRRDANGNVLYQARTWFLADGTLSGPALAAPPLQSEPAGAISGALGLPEYVLYRDGPKQANGTPLTAPTSQSALGFGLRNPDADTNTATRTASVGNDNLKPVMSVVYYGANDMLHAFRAGPQCSTGCGATVPTPYDTGGEELWGFVPHDQLGKLQLIMLQGQDRANHKYVIATALRFADIFVPGNYSDPSGTTRTGHWRKLLFFGRGIGGKYYTALDITNPGVYTQSAASTRAPLVLWNRGNPDTLDGTTAGLPNSATNTNRMKLIGGTGTPQLSTTTDEGAADAAAYATMGQSWSVPAVARVDPAANLNHDILLFVGSGYRTGSAGEGRSFYSIDPLTGDILTQVDVGSGTGSAVADNVIVANPAAFNPAQLSFTTTGTVGTVNPMANRATRVYVGDIHGRLWKFLTTSPGTAVRVQDFGVSQPIGNAVALVNYDGGTGTKPHVYLETGNERRIPTPPALPPPPTFKLVGLEDNGSDTDRSTDNATVLFSFDLAARYRGTVQPAVSFSSAGNARVFMVGTRFNPLSVTGTCQSTFDSILFAVTGQTGVAAYDLNGSGAVDSSDISATLAGKRVNAVSVSFGQVIVDQGLQAQNPPPPPKPPELVGSSSNQRVFVLSVFAGGSTVCR